MGASFKFDDWCSAEELSEDEALTADEQHRSDCMLESAKELVSEVMGQRPSCMRSPVHDVESVTEQECKRAMSFADVELERQFEKHNGYISGGCDTLVETMTIQEAMQRCLALPDCEGFSFRGVPSEEPVRVYFKGKWDLFVHAEETWTSFRFLPPGDNDNQAEFGHAQTVNNRMQGRVSNGKVANRRVNVLHFAQQVNALNLPWGLTLEHGERVLWGPVLFENDLWRAPWIFGRRCNNNKRPSALVVITSRRLAVVRYTNVGSLACFGWCYRSCVETVACVPLKWVLGFSINETFANQRAVAAQFLSSLCCLPSIASDLHIRIMTNGGFGKAYLGPLTISQTMLPRTAKPKCFFEEEKIIELRRWLGNLALFYYECEAGVPMALDLWRCEARDGLPSRGWSPA